MSEASNSSHGGAAAEPTSETLATTGEDEGLSALALEVAAHLKQEKVRVKGEWKTERKRVRSSLPGSLDRGGNRERPLLPLDT